MEYLIRKREEERSQGPRKPRPKPVRPPREDKLFRGKLDSARPGEVDERIGARYFAQIPNIIVDMALSPHAVALYVYYKKEAQASLKRRIRQGAEGIARHMRMSKRSVLNARNELEERGLISLHDSLFNGTWGVEVAVLDIQDHNEELYEAGKQSWPDAPTPNSGTKTARGSK